MNREPIFKSTNDAAALLAMGMLGCDVRNNPHPGGRAFVVVPADDGSFKVEYLERPALPVRKTGIVEVADTASFVLAANRYLSKDNSVIYASLEPAAFTAVLNDHQDKSASQSDASGAGWRDHRVHYALAHSKEFLAWDENDGEQKTQVELAYFIEDNLTDFVKPEGAKMLEIALNFRAKQNVAFKSGIRLQDGQVQLEYVEQNEASASSATGNLKIPEEFSIAIPVWSGLGAKKYDFKARLRYKVGQGAVQLRYELIRPHKVVEQAFKDVLDEIKKGVKDAPVIFGKP